MTSNEHYAILNARFDERSKILRDMGFTYQHLPEWDIAVFWRKRLTKKVPVTVPACFLQLADERTWEDRLKELRSTI
jgi:hypothetical protein